MIVAAPTVRMALSSSERGSNGGRTKMMSPDEVKQTPQTARKLTIFREMLQDGKLGIVQHREDDINVEVGNGMPAQWVGATVFYNPQAGE